MNRAVSRLAYRLILRLHPASFREEFGSEMLWIFEQEQQPGAAAHLFLDGTLSLFRQRFTSQNDSGQLSIASGVMITGPGIGSGTILSSRYRAFAVLPGSHVIETTQSAQRFGDMGGPDALLYRHARSAFPCRGSSSDHAVEL